MTGLSEAISRTCGGMRMKSRSAVSPVQNHSVQQPRASGLARSV
jgi:hypothetical protein